MLIGHPAPTRGGGAVGRAGTRVGVRAGHRSGQGRSFCRLWSGSTCQLCLPPWWGQGPQCLDSPGGLASEMVLGTEAQQAEAVGQHALQTGGTLGQKPAEPGLCLVKALCPPSGLREAPLLAKGQWGSSRPPWPLCQGLGWGTTWGPHGVVMFNSASWCLLPRRVLPLPFCRVSGSPEVLAAGWAGSPPPRASMACQTLPCSPWGLPWDPGPEPSLLHPQGLARGHPPRAIVFG